LVVCGAKTLSIFIFAPGNVSIQITRLEQKLPRAPNYLIDLQHTTYNPIPYSYLSLSMEVDDSPAVGLRPGTP